MPRDAITVTQLSNEGTTPIAQTSGVAANDLSVAVSSGDLVFVEIENVGSASAIATFETPVEHDGIPVNDVDITVPAPTQAALTTALAGVNNDLVFTAVPRGKAGNNITVQYVVAGLSTALSVVVTGTAIVVNVATDGAGAPTSTAAQVETALEANASVAALVTIANAAANDGTGIVAALAATALSGGEPSFRIEKLYQLGTFLQSDGKVYINLTVDNTLKFRAYKM